MLKVGIGVFRFAGSDTPPGFGAKIAQEIIRRNLHIIFGMGSSPIAKAKNIFSSLVTSYQTLIEGGLKAIFMGGESGNDFINQEVMNKGVVFEDIVYTIKALRKAEKKTNNKVYLSLALIYPPPLMGKVGLDKVKEDNLRLIEEVVPDSVMVTPPGPFLHTRWYQEREKFGFNLEEGIIKEAMEYEYVLYKPPHLWPKLGISLEGKSFYEILTECNKFRHTIESVYNIPTDLSDEHFLMFYSAGITKKQETMKYKKETMLGIISCEYFQTRQISLRTNQYSQELAKSNFR